MEKIVEEKVSVIEIIKNFFGADKPEFPEQNPEIVAEWKKVWDKIDKKEAKLTDDGKAKKGKSTIVEQIPQENPSQVKERKKGNQQIEEQSKEQEENMRE